jgi:hypothetical protein
LSGVRVPTSAGLVHPPETGICAAAAGLTALREADSDAGESDIASTTDAEQRLVELQSERELVAKQLQRIAAALTDEDIADVEPVLDNLRSRRREIDAQIEKIFSEVQHAALDPEELADAVVARLRDLPAHADGLDSITKRDLLQAFVEKIEVDMATKNVEVILKLPAWAMKSALERLGKGRLAHSSPSPTVDKTHPMPVVRLALASCRYIHVRGSHRPVCYRCRRKAA